MQFEAARDYELDSDTSSDTDVELANENEATGGTKKSSTKSSKAKKSKSKKGP